MPATGSPFPSLPSPPAWKVASAFAAVYLIWGSTYLAIRFAIETLPPFAMASVRFLVAGAALYLWGALRGAPRPAAAEWRGATLIGGLLLLGGNGAVVWAQQWVASGLAALLVATVPLWMVLLHWLVAGGTRPGPVLVFGVLWGLAGTVLLVGSPDIGGGRALVGGLAVLAGSLCWAAGSVVQRRVRLPASPRRSTALQMIAGGAWLLLASLLAGEAGQWTAGGVSIRSALALAYLTVFGSLVGFSAYIWLLRVSTPARVSTYAYVNPVVALLLGWAFAGETMTPRALLAAAVILSAVMLIAIRGGAGRPGGEEKGGAPVAGAPAPVPPLTAPEPRP